MKKLLILAIAVIVLVGCAKDRNIKAKKAQAEIVGYSKEQVAACMGIPHRSGKIGANEIWEYGTGSETNVSVWTDAYGKPHAVSNTRNCTATITFGKNERVLSMQYSGKTGGLVWEVQKCGELFRNCFE